MMIRGMSTTPRLCTLVLAVLVLGLAAPVWADSVQVFPTLTPVPSTVTDWSSSLTFPQFDPSLGTLTAVTVSLAGSLTTDINITNNSEAGVKRQCGHTGRGFPPGPPDNDLTSPAFSLYSPSYVYSLGAGDSTDSGPLSSTGTGTDTVPPASFGEFTGGGTITLPASTFTETQLANTGGNTGASQMTEASLTGSVTYYYNPPLPATPEPSTLALLAVGALGLVGYGWRRRAV